MNETPTADAINTNKRLFDLVRYMRSPLHEGGLISDKEYFWLASGCGETKSAQRLEDYDDLIKVKDQLARDLFAANEKVEKLKQVIIELTAAGNRVESDKNALRTIFKDLGIGGTFGNASTEAWIDAKEWDREEKLK